jgi:cellulose synthase/poly-beta-1,6-N-acetylglucosamine synthase-like glycosyltransferase
MATFLSLSLITLACFLTIPIAVFVVEVIAATALPQRSCPVLPVDMPRPRVVVLVPAHNEGAGLVPTIEDIKRQIHDDDGVLVIADNCTDDTAAVAAAAGAKVVIRNDPDRRGKGYALACGVDYLTAAPPDIVIVLDADCRLGEGAIDRLVAACTLEHRPAQALDLMTVQAESPISLRVAEFAWRVKNWARPLGLKALGLPCQLMGTGMAFPWDILRSANLGTGLLVEDLKLGLDLALAGYPPLFCPSARVTSDFPLSAEGIRTQRLRWEEGHIWMIVTATPNLVFAGIARANYKLLAVALDMAVPPLSLLGILAMLISLFAGLATLFGVSSLAIWISLTSLVAYVVAICICWLQYGRDVLPPRSILSIAPYLISKLPIYRKLLSGKSRSQWVRTDRGKL